MNQNNPIELLAEAHRLILAAGMPRVHESTLFEVAKMLRTHGSKIGLNEITTRIFETDPLVNAVKEFCEENPAG